MDDQNFQQLSLDCGKKEVPTLIPERKNGCRDVFEIRLEDESTQIYAGHEMIISTKYCIQIYDDLTYEAHYCKKIWTAYDKM